MVNIQEHKNKKILDSFLKKSKMEFPVAKISQRLNYSEGTVSQYINGKVKPSTKFIESLVAEFQLDLSEFEDSEPQIVKEPAPRYVKNDAKPSRRGDDSLYYTNKNGINFYINDETIQIEVKKVPFNAYASYITAYNDIKAPEEEFEKVLFVIN